MTCTLNRPRFFCFVAATLSVIICNLAIPQGLMLSSTSQATYKNPISCILLADPDGWSVDVWEPGQYCLTKSLDQLWPSDILPHQRLPRSALISIYSSNITLDLRGHRLSSSTPILSGIYTNFPSDEKNLPTLIKNGEITTTNKPVVFMVDMWNLENKRFGRGYSLSASHGDISKYKSTAFILDNLTIRSNKHAIIMQGKNNIVRNCVIIGGNGAVNIYGPNLLFENNTVILNATETRSSSDEQPIALHLEDAAQSIVRNNKIIIQGSQAHNAEAIALTNSADVMIEKNTITGTRNVYRVLDERSSASVIGNVIN